jgi:SAM-dependent methyltransferase
MRVLDQCRRALARHGLSGSAAIVVKMILRGGLSRSERIDRDMTFDTQWGVETSGSGTPDISDVVGGNWAYGTKYHGCSAKDLDDLLTRNKLNHREFTFVDLGAGKGRAVLLASRFPFRQVVGVEYSASLCEIAKRNVIRFPKSEQRSQIEIVCEDAAEFTLPVGPLILFMFNPFSSVVMDRVVHNVIESYQVEKRRIVIVYFNALFTTKWDAVNFLYRVNPESDWAAIWDTKAAS